MQIARFLLFIFMAFSAITLQASGEVNSKLETKIAFKPHRKSFTLEKLLKELTEASDIDFVLKESAKAKADMAFKKFSYPNVKAKYVLYRIVKEAGLKYETKFDTIYIY